ncbi:MAG: hypothetical protein QOG94_3270 [Solirubrobacteraceae bacterium]|nr:hypothetical protein [Solirubrobacteraceae bacterium]
MRNLLSRGTLLRACAPGCACAQDRAGAEIHRAQGRQLPPQRPRPRTRHADGLNLPTPGGRSTLALDLLRLGLRPRLRRTSARSGPRLNRRGRGAFRPGLTTSEQIVIARIPGKVATASASSIRAWSWWSKMSRLGRLWISGDPVRIQHVLEQPRRTLPSGQVNVSVDRARSATTIPSAVLSMPRPIQFSNLPTASARMRSQSGNSSPGSSLMSRRTAPDTSQ